MDYLNRKRIALADYLTKKLNQIDWLIPAKVIENSINVYYVYAFRFLPEKIGIKKSTFAKAMRAEGFPVNENYARPLYLFPLYQRKQCYSNSQFPFVSKDYPFQASYSKGICPIAERMYEKELLVTALCQPPQEIRDIDLFIKAIKKIEENIEELKKYET